MNHKNLVSVMVLTFVSCKYGGPVEGAPDTHCGTTVIVPNQASCSTGHHHDEVDGGMPEEHQVRYNSEADDDDCKYHVKYSTTPITANRDFTVTVEVTQKSNNQPATGADPEITALLGETYPAPNTNAVTTEVSAGNYTIGPVRFDKSGQWAMSIHLFEGCSEAHEDSPHSHVAFLVEVP